MKSFLTKYLRKSFSTADRMKAKSSQFHRVNEKSPAWLVTVSFPCTIG